MGAVHVEVEDRLLQEAEDRWPDGRDKHLLMKALLRVRQSRIAFKAQSVLYLRVVEEGYYVKLLTEAGDLLYYELRMRDWARKLYEEARKHVTERLVKNQLFLFMDTLDARILKVTSLASAVHVWIGLLRRYYLREMYAVIPCEEEQILLDAHDIIKESLDTIYELFSNDSELWEVFSPIHERVFADGRFNGQMYKEMKADEWTKLYRLSMDEAMAFYWRENPASPKRAAKRKLPMPEGSTGKTKKQKTTKA